MFLHAKNSFMGILDDKIILLNSPTKQSYISYNILDFFYDNLFQISNVLYDKKKFFFIYKKYLYKYSIKDKSFQNIRLPDNISPLLSEIHNTEEYFILTTMNDHYGKIAGGSIICYQKNISPQEWKTYHMAYGVVSASIFKNKLLMITSLDQLIYRDLETNNFITNVAPKTFSHDLLIPSRKPFFFQNFYCYITSLNHLHIYKMENKTFISHFESIKKFTCYKVIHDEIILLSNKSGFYQYTLTNGIQLIHKFPKNISHNHHYITSNGDIFFIHNNDMYRVNYKDVKVVKILSNIKKYGDILKIQSHDNNIYIEFYQQDIVFLYTKDEQGFLVHLPHKSFIKFIKKIGSIIHVFGCDNLGYPCVMNYQIKSTLKA